MAAAVHDGEDLSSRDWPTSFSDVLGVIVGDRRCTGTASRPRSPAPPGPSDQLAQLTGRVDVQALPPGRASSWRSRAARGRSACGIRRSARRRLHRLVQRVVFGKLRQSRIRTAAARGRGVLLQPLAKTTTRNLSASRISTTRPLAAWAASRDHPSPRRVRPALPRCRARRT